MQDIINKEEVIGKKMSERFFMNGFVCAETAYSILWELGYCGDVPRESIRMMTPFGGGIAGKKYLCGAVEGAIAAIGAKYGRTEIDPAAKEKCNALAARFIDGFMQKYGTVMCGDLIDRAEKMGIRLFTQEIYDYCRPIVAYATELTMEILDSADE